MDLVKGRKFITKEEEDEGRKRMMREERGGRWFPFSSLGLQMNLPEKNMIGEYNPKYQQLGLTGVMAQHI